MARCETSRVRYRPSAFPSPMGRTAASTIRKLSPLRRREERCLGRDAGGIVPPHGNTMILRAAGRLEVAGSPALHHG
jgi:hypothetical protein